MSRLFQLQFELYDCFTVFHDLQKKLLQTCYVVSVQNQAVFKILVDSASLPCCNPSEYKTIFNPTLSNGR